MMKVLRALLKVGKVSLIGFGLIFVIALIASFNNNDNNAVDTVNEPEVVQEVEEPKEEAKQEIEQPKVEIKEEIKQQPEQDLLTLSQKNAVREAESYLSFAPFSRVGLIKQLEFEGYSNEDATYAVDHVKVDWNEQCAKSAEHYLDFMAFSRSGLHDQLEYEGFTEAQIEYGLQAVGY